MFMADLNIDTESFMKLTSKIKMPENALKCSENE